MNWALLYCLSQPISQLRLVESPFAVRLPHDCVSAIFASTAKLSAGPQHLAAIGPVPVHQALQLTGEKHRTPCVKQPFEGRLFALGARLHRAARESD